jgi:hypothetical protein
MQSAMTLVASRSQALLRLVLISISLICGPTFGSGRHSPQTTANEMDDLARQLTSMLLFAEPKGHVKPPEFESELEAASQAGFNVVDHPAIRVCHAALLKA